VNFQDYCYRAEKSTIFGVWLPQGILINFIRGALSKYVRNAHKIQDGRRS
jgi:hypothetical protein